MNHDDKVATMFKRGDRVRLKAWVTRLPDHLFQHGDVGIVAEPEIQIGFKGEALVEIVAQSVPGGYGIFVKLEDLELMPERQVHVVKDGKVYELREFNKYGDVSSTPCFSCNHGGTCDRNKSSHYKKGICQVFKNFQEVKSGKVVS